MNQKLTLSDLIDADETSRVSAEKFDPDRTESEFKDEQRIRIELDPQMLEEVCEALNQYLYNQLEVINDNEPEDLPSYIQSLKVIYAAYAEMISVL